MEKKRMDAQAGTQRLAAPILPESPNWEGAYPVKKPPFEASKRELFVALCLYPAVHFFYFGTGGVRLLPLFCALFCAMAETLYRELPRSRESWFWLGCLLITALAGAYGKNRVWGDYTVLFPHAFAVYWVLSRSGRLLEGETGHLLPLDALFGLIVFPFKHLFLRVRTLAFALTHRKTGEKANLATCAAVGVGALLAGILLVLAVRNLSGADAAFDMLRQRLLGRLSLRVDIWTLWNALLRLPIGAYLFGLLAGTGRETTEAVRARGARVNAGLQGLRRIPALVWCIALGVFALVYLAFFGLQAGYLFGAFARRLPEGYTVAEYARQGFFSLCRVMAVNFALLWLVTRTCVKPVREDRPVLLLCAVLLCQSLVFAVIAASKLYLYIDCFGFTPRRLQSAWLTGVLAAGALCALFSLLTGRKTFRCWTLFSAAALTLLSLY